MIPDRTRPSRSLRLRSLAALLATTLLLGVIIGVARMPVGVVAHAAAAVGTPNPKKPNLFDPQSDSKSAPARQLLSPTLGIQPAANPNLANVPGTAPNGKPGNNAGLMTPESFQLSATASSHFLSRDGKLEIDVPVGAVTAADVAADGGSSFLSVSQMTPGSGSNAGGSGHFTYGTYLMQAVDAKGTVAKHGLRAPVSLKLHFGSQGTALDLTNGNLIVRGYHLGDLGASSTPAGLAALTPAGTTAMGPMTTLSTAFDSATQTVGAMASLLAPMTSVSFGTNSTSVATFGKPQPFEASLSGAALTASYPLDLPAGPKGVTPPLALAYNSAGVNDQHNAQGAAGWVGEGWTMSMGAVSWAEHYVADAGGTAWQDSWQLSDPYGTGVDLIPPTTSTAIYQEDSGHAIATSPIQWQSNPEIYAKIYSFQSALTIAGNPTPPCWRVFLTNGVMEEFGCTADSLEYYPNSAGKAYLYSWLLDLIAEPDGNQIHVTYNRDMESLNGLSYPRDAVMNTVEWDSPTCSNTSTMCSTTGAAPNLWAPLMRVSFSSSHAVVRSPSGSSNCGAATGSLRCDDPVDKTGSGGLGIPSVQSDFVLNDIYTQVCNAGCTSTPIWNTLKDYQLGYDQSGPGSIPIDPITGKLESTAGKLNLTQVAVFGDDLSTALPAVNYTYTKQVEYYEDSLNFPAASPTNPVCSLSTCGGGNGSTNCGPSFNTGYQPYQRGCVLWSESYDGNSYYLSSASNGIGLAQSFTWVNLRSNLHGTDWWNGHNGGYWSNGYNPLWCNTNQSNIYPCDMADDGVWSRIGLASRTDNLVRLTQNGQGGQQTSTPVSGTTSYTYQNVFPDAVQLCPLHTTNNLPSACVAGFSWGSGYDNDFLDFYNGIFMGFTQVQVTNPDGSVEAHKFYSAEGWGGWGTNNAQNGTVGLSIICPYSNVDTCWSDPYWDVANQTNSPGQANALHGHEYELDRYDTNGTTLLEQTKTQYNPICTPPIIPAGSPSVGGYTNNGWGGNLVSSLDLGNPEVPCDVQTTQVDEYQFNGATGTVPDRTTTYAYETGTRPCATCFGREIKTTTASNDGNINSNPVTIVNSTAYTWNDAVTASSTSASGHYLINFVGLSDTEDSNGNKQQCTYTSYDGQANTLGPLAGLTKGDESRSSTYTNCASLTTANELATTSFYDSLGNPVAQRDANMSSYGGSSPSTGCTTPSQGGSTYFTACATFDGYFSALTTQTANALAQSTTIAYQPPASANGSGGFGLWPMSSIDANNQTTSYTYDALGRQTSGTMPLETGGLTTQSMAYTVWCSGPAAQSPCAEIDKTQRLNSTQTVTGRTFYDGWGNVVETRSPGPTGQDVVQYYFYDPLQRRVFKSVAYLVVTYTGGPGAAAYSIPDSTVAGTTYSYDGLGRTKSVRDPVSSIINISFGVACNAAGTGDSACYVQVLTDDPLNHQSGALQDALGRTLYEQKYTGNTTATWAVYATTKYRYDYVGDLTWILHPDGATTSTSAYDMAKRETSNFDADVRQQNFSYDKNGNLTEMIDGRQSAAGTTFMGYDLLNRPIWRNTSNTPTGAYDTYSYDSQAGGNFGVGRLTGETFTAAPANTLSGSESFGYDARGRQTSSTLTVGSTSYPLHTAYDDAGNVLNQTYPTGEVVTNSLTAQDWLSGVSTSLGNATLLSAATYSGTGGANGLMTSASLGGGTYQYGANFDLLSRATDINLKKGSTTLFDQTRTFDAAGNVSTANTTLSAGTDNQAFCYDEQNRVVAAASSGTVPCNNFSPGTLTAANYNQSFSYDNMGRLTNGPLGAYTYPAAGAPQVHAASKIGTSYTAAYDGAGNMTCRAATSATTCQGTQTGAQLAYNNQGQLSNWQDKPGAPTTTGAFLYDGDGNRVAEQTVSGGVTTTVAYVGDVEQATYVVGGTSNIIPLSLRTGSGNTPSSSAALSAPISGARAGIHMSGPTSPTFMQGTTFVTGTRLNSQTVTLGAVTAGDLLVGEFAQYDSTGQVSVSDNVNGAWTRSVSTTWHGGSSPGDVALYYLPNSAAAPSGLTITVSATNATYLQGAPAEYSGVATSSPLDQAVVASGSSTSADSGLTPSTGAGELVYGGMTTTNNAGTLTPGSSQGVSFTLRAQSSNGNEGFEDVLSSAAGQQHAGFTFPTSTPWFMVAGVFKAAGGATVPGAPTNASATAGNAQATVTWTAPGSNGGSAITYYTVTSSPGGFTAQTANGSTTTATVTGLTNGTSYTFTVTATNAIGTGPASSPSNAVTPSTPTAPGSPTGASATAGNAQATVTWTAPSSNGGSAITYYTVTSSPGGFTAQTANGSTTTATVTGLSNGTSYTFTVTATNAVGTGPASSPSNAVTPSASSSITFVQGQTFATGGRVTSQTVTFAAVAAGDLLVGEFGQYDSTGQVSVSDNVNGAWTRSVSTTWNGSAGDVALYYFANSAAAPSGLTITITAANATYLQGSPAEYSGVATVNALDQAAVAKGSSTSADSGLTSATGAGELVYAGMTATNGAGTLTPGSSQGVTFVKRAQTSTGTQGLEDIVTSAAGQQHAGFTFPTSVPWFMVAGVFKAAGGATVPGAPTGVSATGGMGQATVSWTAPASNGGSAITYYKVTSSPGGLTAQTANGSTMTATVTGLTNGTTYTFTITATNAIGTGPASSASNAVTTGITIRTYYYAAGMRIAAAVNGVFSYLASDGLRSADVTLDANGNVTASTLYAPYGGARYAIGIASTDYGFTGQHADTISGLDYYGSRYYDSIAGQFTSPDTVLPGNGFDIWGLSRYAYVEGNPEIRIDPTGHIHVLEDGGGCDQSCSSTSTASAPASKPLSWAQPYLQPAVNAAFAVLGWATSPEVQRVNRGVAGDLDKWYDMAYSLTPNGLLNDIGIGPNYRDPLAQLDSAMGGNMSSSTEYQQGQGVSAFTQVGLIFTPQGDAAAASEATTVTEEGLGQVEQHLAQFGDHPPNAAMVERLRTALGNGGSIEGADANFYNHELTESSLMNGGMSYDEAHATALEQHGVSPYSLYHPDVIQQFPEYFNRNWRDFWGLDG
jgi:RHS repeat-associated protein